MLRVLGIGLRLLAWIFRHFPLQRRVVMLSRQGSKPSVDFLMLKDKLAEIDTALPVIIRCTKPEQHGIMQLIGPMCNQLWYACTSRVVILDGYNPCICIPPKRRGVFVIQLWHAVGAVKKFGYQSLDTPAGRSSSYAKLAHMHQNYDLIVSTGLGSKQAYSEAFGYPAEKIVSLGLPRIDNLYAAPSKEHVKKLLAKDYPWLCNGNKNILYAPTLRAAHIKDNWAEDAICKLARSIAPLPVNLIVSKHPLTTLKNPKELPSNVFVMLGHQTEELLQLADVVISDYSAIALEAGIVGCPVLFYMPDYEEYRLSPGLNIDPMKDNQLFGTALASEIAEVLNNPIALRYIQSEFANFINTYFTGLNRHSTERVIQLICKHIDK